MKLSVKALLKATGTRWIEHRIRAMGRLDDKVGLYASHMKEFIDDNLKTKETVKGKLEKVLDAQVFLRSAFLKDLLTSYKVFSLVNKKQYPHLIEQLRV